MPPEPTPRFLSPADFARATGLSEATVRRRIRDGSLPVAQPGGKKSRVLIPRDVLDRSAPAPGPSVPAPGPTPPAPRPAGPRPRWTRA
jgi:excisionase family DNA binding protein